MDKKLVVLLLLFFLSFGIFASVVVFNKPLTQLARAKEDVIPAADKSKILAFPLYSIPANGKAESLITVFVNSVSDKPLANKTVSAASSLGKLSSSFAVTNAMGKAEFHLTSSEPGTAKVDINVENVKLQSISVKFQ